MDYTAGQRVYISVRSFWHEDLVSSCAGVSFQLNRCLLRHPKKGHLEGVPWASGMAQWVKALATKSDNLTTIPATHVEGENQLLHGVLWPPNSHVGVYTHNK